MRLHAIMYRKVSEFIVKGVKKNKRLLGNTAYLYIFQFVNYIIPLITVPYLIRVLGTNTFGVIVFYSSLIIYFQIIVDYGFNLSATRQVSLLKGNNEGISRLFFSVIIIKILLIACCAVVLFFLIMYVPQINKEKYLCIWFYAGVMGSILFPMWLFQGLEDMKYITIFNCTNKFFACVFYFIFIKSPQDYLWFAYLNTGSTYLIGMVSISIALVKYNIKWHIPKRSEMYVSLREGFQIFVSQFSVCLFTNTNIFILGILTTPHIVGAYAVAEKIIRAVISLTGPIGSAIYPRVSQMFENSSKQALLFLKKISIAGSGIFGVMSILLFILADFLVVFVAGVPSKEISTLIRIMSLLPVTVFLDNIFGTQIMLNNNMKKQFMYIIVFGGIFSVMMLIILVPQLKGTGSAISFVSSEITILLAMILTVRKKGIRLFRFL